MSAAFGGASARIMTSSTGVDLGPTPFQPPPPKTMPGSRSPGELPSDVVDEGILNKGEGGVGGK